jgi:Flp pilus assembly pilin Flp
MPDDDVPNNLKTLWEGMNTNPLHLSPDQLREEAEKLQKGLRKRSIVVRLVALLVIAGFALLLTHFHSALQRIGSALAILGGTDMFVTQLRRRPARVMPDTGQTECIRFYRAALERQRDFHRGTWFGWLLRLTLPAGVLIFCAGTALADPEHATVVGLIAAVWLIMAVRAVQLSLRLARMFQGRIDALDASFG